MGGCSSKGPRVRPTDGLSPSRPCSRTRCTADAADAVRKLEQSLPLLEAFVSAPYPSDTLQVWYGFKVGNSGARGAIYTEDRLSYVSRSVALPYDAAIYHELSHSYFGSESLTQFLEVYLLNRQSGSSEAFVSWSYRRGAYSGMSDGNQGVAALLDVYQLIGPAAMGRAYGLAFPLAPPYNQPLSPAVQQVFVDQASADAKAQVAAKMARILT